MGRLTSVLLPRAVCRQSRQQTTWEKEAHLGPSLPAHIGSLLPHPTRPQYQPRRLPCLGRTSSLFLSPASTLKYNTLAQLASRSISFAITHDSTDASEDARRKKTTLIHSAQSQNNLSRSTQTTSHHNPHPLKMQISNILLTVLAAGASVVSAQDSTTVMTTSLTKSVTLTKVSATTSTLASSAVSNTTESIATATTSTYFPLGNSTSVYPSGTGVMHTSTKASATATESSGETGSATGSAAASSSSSAAAAGAQTLQGGLVLGALGAIAMLV